MKTLYKMNVTGRIEMWTVDVSESKKTKTATVQVVFGELDGELTTKTYLIKEGKNIGKKNERSIFQQAHFEADARYTKKLKEGYVEKLEDAKDGKTSSIIEGGIVPMTAHKFQDYSDDLKFPVAVQPKLDGQRCIATKTNGVVKLWTRTRKSITSCPHIVKQVEELLAAYSVDCFLDGELYHHELKHEFEKLMKAVRKQSPSKESAQVQYHVYDGGFIGSDSPFKQRSEWLRLLPDWFDHIKFVETISCPTLASVEGVTQALVDEGYEGSMVRIFDSFYEHKRSKNLLKFKTFDDHEFKIIGVQPGDDDTVMFVCVTETGAPFKATMSGDKAKNQKFLTNHKLWNGKKLTVKYQGLTNKNGVPRFPVGLRIREDE